jgi:hypothetical protein
MAVKIPAGTRFKLPNDQFPYIVNVKHGLEHFYPSYHWATANIAKDMWRMTINNTHYVFYFKQQEDAVKFALTWL